MSSYQKQKKKIIISTGMSNLKDVKRTVSIYNRDSRLSLLHCVSNYPCSLSSLNLNNIDTLKKFGYEVGFSDHSKDHLSSALAIAKGAKIIEKHITLDNKLPGPDHKASLNLKDFKKFLENIRITNKILGSYEKTIQFEEKEMHKISRKSLYYSKKFTSGKKIKKKDMIPLRPHTGIEVSEYKKFLNKELKIAVKKNQKVSLKDFK